MSSVGRILHTRSRSLTDWSKDLRSTFLIRRFHPDGGCTDTRRRTGIRHADEAGWAYGPGGPARRNAGRDVGSSASCEAHLELRDGCRTDHDPQAEAHAAKAGVV